mmetsp:Transcript_24820/g.34745  ORF Transcript_24820/g.34745 Transcript_24820/m.34745 type:complete len:187 (+) Transcript_24820:140-700(+)
MPSIWKYLFGSKNAATPQQEENIRESVVKVEDQEWVVFEESAAVDVKSQPIFAPTLSGSFEQIRNTTSNDSERVSASEHSSAGTHSTPVIETPPPATASTEGPSERAITTRRTPQNQELVNALWGQLEVDTTKHHDKTDVAKETKRRDRMTKYPAAEKKARHATPNQQRTFREKKHGKIQKNNRKM